MVYRSVVPATSALVRQRSAARLRETLNQMQKLPADLQSLLAKIKKVAAATGFSVYLVGGFVRDLFLGEPTKDLDVVVEGNGIIFARHLREELKPCRFTRHETFGQPTSNWRTERISILPAPAEKTMIFRELCPRWNRLSQRRPVPAGLHYQCPGLVFERGLLRRSHRLLRRTAGFETGRNSLFA
jgi:hypothetical protein